MFSGGDINAIKNRFCSDISDGNTKSNCNREIDEKVKNVCGGKAKEADCYNDAQAVLDALKDNCKIGNSSDGKMAKCFVGNFNSDYVPQRQYEALGESRTTTGHLQGIEAKYAAEPEDKKENGEGDSSPAVEGRRFVLFDPSGDVVDANQYGKPEDSPISVSGNVGVDVRLGEAKAEEKKQAEASLPVATINARARLSKSEGGSTLTAVAGLSHKHKGVATMGEGPLSRTAVVIGRGRDKASSATNAHLEVNIPLGKASSSGSAGNPAHLSEKAVELENAILERWGEPVGRIYIRSVLRPHLAVSGVNSAWQYLLGDSVELMDHFLQEGIGTLDHHTDEWVGMFQYDPAGLLELVAVASGKSAEDVDVLAVNIGGLAGFKEAQLTADQYRKFVVFVNGHGFTKKYEEANIQETNSPRKIIPAGTEFLLGEYVNALPKWVAAQKKAASPDESSEANNWSVLLKGGVVASDYRSSGTGLYAGAQRSGDTLDFRLGVYLMLAAMTDVLSDKLFEGGGTAAVETGLTLKGKWRGKFIEKASLDVSLFAGTASEAEGDTSAIAIPVSTGATLYGIGELSAGYTWLSMGDYTEHGINAGWKRHLYKLLGVSLSGSWMRGETPLETVLNPALGGQPGGGRPNVTGSAGEETWTVQGGPTIQLAKGASLALYYKIMRGVSIYDSNVKGTSHFVGAGVNF